MQLPAVKRITIDGVPDEQQATVETIANILNPFMDDVSRILNGGIGSDNVESKIVSFGVKTDPKGALLGVLDVLTGLKRVPYGHSVINIVMTDNANQVPNITNTPFLLYQPLSPTVIRINKILNLMPNSKYTITVEFK